MANFIGTGLGDGGAPLTDVSASGTFTWGVIYAGTEKTLSLLADPGTLPGACLLEFTGDTSAFVCTEIEGNVLAAPVEVGSLSLNTRYFSWAEDSTTTLKFEPIYVDGTAKTVSLDVQDALGNPLSTIPMTATYADLVIGAVAAIGNELAMWTARDITPGALLADDVAAYDISGATGAKHLYTADANKTIVALKPPGAGSSSFLANCIETSVTGAAAIVGVDADLNDDVQGWWAIVGSDDWNALTSACRFTASGDKTGTTALAASYDIAKNSIRAIRPNSYSAGSKTTSGSKAYFIAVECQPGDTNVVWHIADMEGTWAGRTTITQGMGVYTRGKGMAFFGEINCGGTLRIWPGSSHHTTSPVAAEWESIYDACKT